MTLFSFSLLLAVLLSCISLALRLSTANIQGNETDRLALLAFKSQINLDPHNVTASWNDSHHFCEWEGVVCSQRHQRVTVLNLSSKGLVGRISPHIGNLSFLRTLRLSHNGFQGEIPQELGHLFRLEDLILGNNSLVGKFPVNISRCSNLINLFCAYNKLVGPVPMELGYLTKLVRMSLDVNMLTGEIPPSLGNLTSIEALSISYSNFVGGIPSTFGQLKRLKFLSLGSCKLSGTFPPFLYNLSALETISIPENHFTGEVLNEIGLLLPNLKFFLIGINQFSGPIPTSLFNNATKLQELDIGHNQFSGFVPTNAGNLRELTCFLIHNNNLGSGRSGDLDFFSSLPNCSHLHTLGVGTNRFGGVLPASVANFSSQLSTLDLGRNQISGNIPIGVGHLQNLSFLDLSSNFLTGSIPLSIGNLQNLHKLHLGINQLSGQIPSSITNMSKLYYLNLSKNRFEGSIASSLDNQILQTLDLSYNNLIGPIPKQEIDLSSRLVTLDLSHNSLDGSIPFEIGRLKNLEDLNLSENNLVGEIPSALGSCSSLEYLYLQGNLFQGPLPYELGALKGLQVLDVSRNNISGNIPKELEELSLQRLNLSFNNLEGEVPIQGIFQNTSVVSVVGNNKICGGIPKLKLPKCKTHKHKLPLTLKVTLGVLIPSFLVAMFLLIYLWKQPKTKLLPETICGDLTRVSYNDLHKATYGFSSENLIGTGSYGSVYKGILHHGEGFIAVKVFDLMRQGASKSFMAECEALRGVRHRNLLKILTVCSSVDSNGNDFKALVFNFMPNGSLDSWLHPSSNGQHQPNGLNLYQRLSIAIDVASALDYLHNYCERPIIHCDLKLSNVLLSDDMTAHVADFGIAKLLSNSTNTSGKTESNSIALRGTVGYIPPEYGLGSEVSKQGDMYSYGILLLEMLTGKRPTNHMFKDGLSLREYSRMALPLGVMDIVDMRLVSKTPNNGTAIAINQINESLSSMVRIGLACSEEVTVERMDIRDVLKELSSIKEGLLRV